MSVSLSAASNSSLVAFFDEFFGLTWLFKMETPASAMLANVSKSPLFIKESAWDDPLDDVKSVLTESRAEDVSSFGNTCNIKP